MTEPEKTIMQAAANIALEDARSLLVNAETADERAVIRAAVYVHDAIETYLRAHEDLDRPF